MRVSSLKGSTVLCTMVPRMRSRAATVKILCNRRMIFPTAKMRQNPTNSKCHHAKTEIGSQSYDTGSKRRSGWLVIGFPRFPLGDLSMLSNSPVRAVL